MQIAPNDRLTISRLAVDDDAKKRYTEEIYSALSCYTEPIQDEFALGAFEQNASYPKKAYDFGGVFDIRVGDLAEDSEGKKWIVKGVRIFSGNLDIENDIELLLSAESQ